MYVSVYVCTHTHTYTLYFQMATQTVILKKKKNNIFFPSPILKCCLYWVPHLHKKLLLILDYMLFH